MKTSISHLALSALLAFGLASATPSYAADSADRAAATKGKIEALRVESAKIRNQTLLTMEALKRLNVKGVELRPEFEKYKTELAEMEVQAKIARDRADT